jgi:hypothetical protein
MQILAGSLNVEVPGLLHAGYISASPHSFIHGGGAHQFAYQQTKVIDVPAVLALKASGGTGEQLASPAVAQPTASIGTGYPGSVGQAAGLAVAFVLFAYLLGLYFGRMSKKKWMGWMHWGFALAAICLLVGIVNIIDAGQVALLNHSPCPWRNIAVQEYQDPGAATEAIMHGLIVNGLAGCPFRAENLSAIQKEVAFPVPSETYTPGMAYAQKTYGRDGWGREFKFEFLGWGYRVTSAGPDGVFGTADDIVVETRGIRDSWDRRISSVYVLRLASGPRMCLLHRVGDDLYEAADAKEARRVAGNDQFDTFGFNKILGEYGGNEQPPGVRELKKHAELFDSSGGKNRLFLVYFQPKKDG